MVQSYKIDLDLPQSPISQVSDIELNNDLQYIYRALHLLAHNFGGFFPAVITYTFAALPPASTVLVNTFALVSDLSNTVWISTGTSWRLLNGYAVISQSGAFNSVTGTAAKTILKSFTLPANVLGDQDVLRISGIFSFTSSANTKSIGIDFGGTTIYTGSYTATSLQAFTVDIRATNSTTAQIIQPAADINTAGAITVSAIDTTVSSLIELWGTLTDTTETITMNAYTIELLKI